MGWAAGATVLALALFACNKNTVKPTPQPTLSTEPAPTVLGEEPSTEEPPPAATTAGPPPTAEGEVVYVEKSGENLYVEIKIAGDKTVGVELLPAAAARHAKKIKKGEQLAVHGKRLKGNKDVAFTVEVSDPAGVHLGSEAAATGGLARLRAPRRFGRAKVEMIAAYGMWAPFDAGDIRKRVATARGDGVTRLVLDTGLTELYRAYEKPGPFYEVIGQAAAEARRQGIETAFYFPSFEIRREKQTRGGTPMTRWHTDWPQHTLAGKPFIKSAFGKEEFWNKEGDEALWACPLSPWRKVFIERMKGAVRRGARTLFIDVPYLQKTAKHVTCRCRHCQARFKRDTGQTIPTRAARSQAYHRFLWWRHEVINGFFRELRQAIRTVDRGARLVIEEYPAYVDGATTATGVDIGLVGPEDVDNFAHEYSAKQFDKKPFSNRDRLELATTLALYRGLDGDRPTWVLSYANDPRGSRVNAAVHLAYDASFWETKGPEMNDTTVGRAWRRKLFTWFGQHRDAFGQSRQLATVAVLYSPASRDFTAGHFRALRQATMALTRARVPFRVLSTRDLAELGDYETLVLPAVAALADAEAGAIRRGKARVLVVGQPPSKDAWGLAAKNHGIQFKRVSIAGLPAAVGSLAARVEGKVAVNVLARAGEIQVRLAALGRPTTAKVSLIPPAPVTRATRLALLGPEGKLQTTTGPDGSVQFTVQVKDLTIARLRIR
jgi:hypothetical protein